MQKNNSISLSDQDEYQQVRRDLIFVVTLNVIFAALLIGLYFFNRSTGQVDSFFNQIIRI